MAISIDRLSSLDQLMLQVSEIWPQDIGALGVLDGTSLLEPSGRFQTEAVIEAIEPRLDSVPRFRQVIRVPRRGLGEPLWVDDPSFDLREHVRVWQLPSGSGETELLATVEQLRRRRLDPSRPLWEMWFLPGLSDGQVGMFVKLHHAIADGMAAMSTISALLDAQPDGTVPPARPWTPRRPPKSSELLTDTVTRHLHGLSDTASALARPRTTLHQMRSAWRAVREIQVEGPAAVASLDRMVGLSRTVAVLRTTLDQVTGVAHAHGATVNDVLLTITAGGLRAILRSRGENVEGTTVRVYAPVSLRARTSGPQRGNQIAQMTVPLPLGGTDAVRRLRTIATETATRKARARTSLATLLRGRLARRMMMRAAVRQHVNVTTADIPGPTVPLYLAGARLLAVFPVLPLIANEPLGIGALSYAGAFTIGIVADPDAYPDLDVFTAGMRDELHTLGVSTRTPVGSHP